MLRFAQLEKKAFLFCKDASIESDMAKRIMLSIIPMFKQEHGGYDLIVLKSAVQGAKDLIRYGALICYDELTHINGEFYAPSDDARNKSLLFYKIAASAISDKNYQLALEACKNAFSLPGWHYMYGGRKWATIADTLFKISTKYQQLNTNDIKTDPEKEFELMKEIVVLMNVFDGLAHNTGSILNDLLAREARSEKSDSWQKGETGQHIDDIIRMMDAKELEDPIEVYKQIEHIIDQTPYKMMFKDYLNKLRNHPSYNKYEDRTKTDNKIRLIRERKKINQHISFILKTLDKIEKIYEHMSQENQEERQESFYKLKNEAGAIITYVSLLNEVLNVGRNIFDWASYPKMDKINRLYIELSRKISLLYKAEKPFPDLIYNITTLTKEIISIAQTI